MVTEKALLPVLDLDEFPNSVVDVFIEFPQTDAGTRCAGICAASIALADAGLKMKDMVSSVSVGKLGPPIMAIKLGLRFFAHLIRVYPNSIFQQ